MDPMTDNGTTPGTEPAEKTAAEQQPQTPPAPKPGAESPKPPSEAPPEGTKYVYDPKTGRWDLRRDDQPAAAQPHDPVPASDKPQQTDPADEPPVSGVQLPDYLPDHVRDDAELGEPWRKAWPP